MKALLGSVLVLGCLASAVTGATFRVNTAADTDDGRPYDPNAPTSLRKAIRVANISPGPDRIEFAIGRGLVTIQPGSPLPSLTGSVVINGFTQPGSQPNTDPLGNNAVLAVAIDGSRTAGDVNSDGLVLLTATNCEIRGLIIHSFAHSMININKGANNNVIAGNWIGLKPDGITRGGRLDNNGIFIIGSANNRIGGTAPADRNVISGNGEAGRVSDSDLGGLLGQNGLFLFGRFTTNNTVVGNFIGTDAHGVQGVPNRTGIFIQSSGNRIGDGTAAGRNVISGNISSGIDIWAYLTNRHTNNLVRGNYVGLSGNASLPVPNKVGIDVSDADQNAIGGPASGDANVISGNTSYGISIKTWHTTPSGLHVAGTGATNNVVQRNFIGTDPTGLLAFSNGASGIFIDSTDGGVVINNHIGSLDSGHSAGNIISANHGHGIQLSGAGTTKNSIQSNYIGVNANSEGALGNDGAGVWIGHLGAGTGSPTRNIIGGTDPFGEGNVVSANKLSGIAINFEATPTAPTGGGHLILGNMIGTDLSGTRALGNLQGGILISEAVSGVVIGGAALGAGNLISGNQLDGIKLQGASVSDCLIQGNKIGTDFIGAVGLGNWGSGIRLEDARHTVVGSSKDQAVDPAAANMIADNRAGVSIGGNAAVGNTVRGNHIFGNALLGLELGPGPELPLNDTGDADTGPNGLINTPGSILVKFDPSSGQTKLNGRVDTTNAQNVWIDFYKNDAAGPVRSSGKDFLTSVHPDAEGRICASFPGDLSAFSVTATATGTDGSTSGFSSVALFKLVALEVNQSVQDWRNNVLLVEGKTTVVRAHLQTLSCCGDVQAYPIGLRARLHGRRDGSPLPNSPKTPLGFAPIDVTHQADLVRTNWERSINFGCRKAGAAGTWPSGSTHRRWGSTSRLAMTIRQRSALMAGCGFPSSVRHGFAWTSATLAMSLAGLRSRTRPQAWRRLSDCWRRCFQSRRWRSL